MIPSIQTQQQQQQLQQQQQPQVIDHDLEAANPTTNSSSPSTTSASAAPSLDPQPRKMVNSATIPEISSKHNSSSHTSKNKLPAVKSSSTSQQNLSLTTTNVGLHNKGHVDEKMDLDQTTMIGSALDLDSLGKCVKNEAQNI